MRRARGPASSTAGTFPSRCSSFPDHGKGRRCASTGISSPGCTNAGTAATRSRSTAGPTGPSPAPRRGAVWSRRRPPGAAPSSGRSTPAKPDGGSSWVGTCSAAPVSPRSASRLPAGSPPCPRVRSSPSSAIATPPRAARYSTSSLAPPTASPRCRSGRAVVDRWGRRRARQGASVRLALHPLDLTNPALVESSLGVVDRLLESGAKARTYGDFVTAHRPVAGGRAA
jgi:hypothetical protein